MTTATEAYSEAPWRPVTRGWVGEETTNATTTNRAPRTLSVCCFLPVDASQMQTVLSAEPVTATSAVGCRITLLTFFLCPFILFCIVFLFLLFFFAYFFFW